MEFRLAGAADGLLPRVSYRAIPIAAFPHTLEVVHGHLR